MSILKCLLYLALFIECGRTLAFGVTTSFQNKSQQPDEFRILVSGDYDIKRTFAKYVVSIRTGHPTAFFGDDHFCAGTIVAPRLVVTAAHCITNPNKAIARPQELTVVAGTPNRLRRSSDTVELEVQAITPHPAFAYKGQNDIALLLLNNSVPLDNDAIKIIPIANKRAPAGTKCTAVGWGRLFDRGPFAANALSVDMSIIDDRLCKKIYSRAFDVGLFCAVGSNIWSKSACRGDSGGPLICGDKLSGIISWGGSCRRPSHPIVFTDMAYFREWIGRFNV